MAFHNPVHQMGVARESSRFGVPKRIMEVVCFAIHDLFGTKATKKLVFLWVTHSMTRRMFGKIKASK